MNSEMVLTGIEVLWIILSLFPEFTWKDWGEEIISWAGESSLNVSQILHKRQSKHKSLFNRLSN